MKRLKKTLVSVLVLCSLLSAAGYYTGHCSAAEYVMTEEQLNALEQELTMLSENNSKQLNLLEESESELIQATDASTALREQLQTAREELLRLRNQLQTLKAESVNAENSLEIANKELEDAAASLKKSADRTKCIERQRNFWEIIAGILGVVAVTR